MAKQPSGLGKGLGALIGEPSIRSAAASEGITTLPLSQVEPGLNQPRKHFDDEAIEELADSIRSFGVVSPITVRRLSSGYYQIIAGERRWRASKQAGLSEIPAVIIEADDRKVMEIGLVENLQREDLNPMEVAAGYQRLINDFDLTQEAVGERMNKPRSSVTNALRLLNLPPSVQPMVEDGTLSAGHAKAILSLSSAEKQEKLADLVVQDGLSVRETERLARAGMKSAKPKVEKPAPPLAKDDPRIYVAALEEDLGKRYGRKVNIKAGKKRGKIELEYYSSDDLEALLTLLGGGLNH